MKKICFLLAFVATIGLTACGGGKAINDKPADIAAAIVAGLPSDVSMVELDSARIANYYTIDMSKVEELSVYIEGSGGFADEVAVFRMKSTDDIEEAKAAVEKRVEKQRKGFDGYVPAEVERIDNNSVVAKQNYLLFVISDDEKAAEDIFKAYFK